MSLEYLQSINQKETNTLLVSLRTYAEENKVPIITEEGIRFLQQIIQLTKAKRVLEIGCAIGYSSISMAHHTNASITTIERDEQMVEIAKKNVSNANLSHKIDIIYNDALNVDESSLGEFDLIFIDAAKAQSIKFFEKYEKNLSKNGVIITDNLLFHGLITQEVKDRNLRQLLRKIDRFNKYVTKRKDYDTFVYGIGDGMSVSIKRSD